MASPFYAGHKLKEIPFSFLIGVYWELLIRFLPSLLVYLALLVCRLRRIVTFLDGTLVLLLRLAIFMESFVGCTSIIIELTIIPAGLQSIIRVINESVIVAPIITVIGSVLVFIETFLPFLLAVCFRLGMKNQLFIRKRFELTVDHQLSRSRCRKEAKSQHNQVLFHVCRFWSYQVHIPNPVLLRCCVVVLPNISVLPVVDVPVDWP